MEERFVDLISKTMRENMAFLEGHSTEVLNEVVDLTNDAIDYNKCF